MPLVETGAPTFVDLQNEVMTQGGYGEADRTRIKSVLNLANREVCSERRWYWNHDFRLLTLAAGTFTYSTEVSANVYPIFRGRIASATNAEAPRYIEYSSMEPGTFIRLLSDTTTRGTPTQYTVLENQFYFSPVPDKTYQFTYDYWPAPAIMTGDTDVPPIPIAYREVLVYGALMRMALRDKQPGMAREWRDLFDNELTKMEANDRLQSTEEATRTLHGTRVRVPAGTVL